MTGSIAALLNDGFRRAAPHLDAGLGVQFHDEQRVFVEHLLQSLESGIRAASVSNFVTSSGSDEPRKWSASPNRITFSPPMAARRQDNRLRLGGTAAGRRA